MDETIFIAVNHACHDALVIIEGQSGGIVRTHGDPVMTADHICDIRHLRRARHIGYLPDQPTQPSCIALEPIPDADR